jgi:hypothetical protein
MADTAVDIQGYLVKAVDNGDGTYSFASTTSNDSVNGVSVEFEGLRFRLVPLGGSPEPISGKPFYAIMTG